MNLLNFSNFFNVQLLSFKRYLRSKRKESLSDEDDCLLVCPSVA
jgi:hypothetical protein